MVEGRGFEFGFDKINLKSSFKSRNYIQNESNYTNSHKHGGIIICYKHKYSVVT